MQYPQTVLLYVEKVADSAAFFRDLFGVPIVEQSDNFAMLPLPSGVGLGLWARHDVSPAPVAGVAGFELCVTVKGDADVDAALAEATKRGITVVQPLSRLDFGYTFLLRSPDGHLVRVFSPPM